MEMLAWRLRMRSFARPWHPCRKRILPHWLHHLGGGRTQPTLVEPTLLKRMSRRTDTPSGLRAYLHPVTVDLQPVPNNPRLQGRLDEAAFLRGGQ